jgi:hypothetical protein
VQGSVRGAPRAGKRMWCTFCSDALLYLQYLNAKDTGRQDVEWVNDTVSIIAFE